MEMAQNKGRKQIESTQGSVPKTVVLGCLCQLEKVFEHSPFSHLRRPPMPQPVLLILPAFAFPFQPCPEDPAGASAGERVGGPGGQRGVPQPSAAGSLGGGARRAPGACRQIGKSRPCSGPALQVAVGKSGVRACGAGEHGERVVGDLRVVVVWYRRSPALTVSSPWDLLGAAFYGHHDQVSPSSFQKAAG